MNPTPELESRRCGPTGRPVYVVAVDESVEDAPLPHPFEPGDEIETAAEASRRLGSTFNSVAVALAKVKGVGDVEDRAATIRGVTFQYLEDAINGVHD